MALPIRTLAAAAAFLLAVSAALAQTPTVGTAETETLDDGWTGAILAGQDGSFAACRIESAETGGTKMQLALTGAGEVAMTLEATRWSQEPESRSTVSFWLDRDAPRSVSATATGENALRLDVPIDNRLVRQLQLSRSLFVLSRGVQSEFGLSGSAQALQWLYRCVEQNSDETFENVLFEQPSEEEKQREAAKKEAEITERVALAEATALLANLLSRATVTDFELTIDRDVDSGISWKSPEAGGTLAMISAEDVKRLDEIRAELVGAAAVSCGGSFSSKRHDTGAKNYMLVRTECAGGQASATKLLAAVETRSGGALMLIEADGETVPAIDRLLAGVQTLASGEPPAPAQSASNR